MKHVCIPIEIRDAADIATLQDALMELKCRGLKLTVMLNAEVSE